MMPLSRIILCLTACCLAAGCSSVHELERQEYKGPKLPRPAHIWVYDFAATLDEVPGESSLDHRLAEHTSPQTKEQIAAGHQAGAQLAAELVRLIAEMGLPAARATSATKPAINDIVFRGYILSVEEGDATKRVAIGFGSGASMISAAIEAFQVTNQGLRKLGSGKLRAGGSETPGAGAGLVGTLATANPAGLIVSSGVKAYGEYSGSSKIEGRAKEAAKEIAERLRPKFREQGWIR